jgi:hypothetical protein
VGIDFASFFQFGIVPTVRYFLFCLIKNVIQNQVKKGVQNANFKSSLNILAMKLKLDKKTSMT